MSNPMTDPDDLPQPVDSCTQWVGGPDINTGYRCGQPIVLIDIDGESAWCLDCQVWQSYAGRQWAPIRMLT